MKTTTQDEPVIGDALPSANPAEAASFAETALKLGGKSAEEARRTGAIDRADDQVEALFAPQYQTVNSPVHRAVWDRGVPVELFQGRTPETPPDVQKVMDGQSLDVVRRHREAGTLLNEQDKIADAVLERSGAAGYWGLLVDKEYGGSGAPFAASRRSSRGWRWSTRRSPAWPVHGCIGAVDPVRTFGNAEQKQRFLPRLASGERLSAFALTEPCAGSDLTALRTTRRAATATTTSSTARSCSSPTSCPAARSAWCA